MENKNDSNDDIIIIETSNVDDNENNNTQIRFEIDKSIKRENSSLNLKNTTDNDDKIENKSKKKQKSFQVVFENSDKKVYSELDDTVENKRKNSTDGKVTFVVKDDVEDGIQEKRDKPKKHSIIFLENGDSDSDNEYSGKKKISIKIVKDTPNETRKKLDTYKNRNSYIDDKKLSIEPTATSRESYAYDNPIKIYDGVDDPVIDNRNTLHTNRGGYVDYEYKPTDFGIKIATRFVINAKEGHKTDFKRTDKGLKYYDLYFNKWMILFIYTTIFVNIVVLPFFEKPAFVDTPFWIPCIVELICLLIYVLRIANEKLYRANVPFYIDKTNLITSIVIILNFIDIIAYIIVNAVNAGFIHRYTRALRVVYYINFPIGSQMKRALRNLYRTFPAIFNIYIVFFTSLLIFTFLLWQLLKNKDLVYAGGDPYFVNYADTLFDLYIAVTTANFPDVMMPAYNYNGFYAILFLGFMVLNLYLFVNIILATSYSHFRHYLRQEIKSEIQDKRRSLEEAFHLLKKRMGDEGETGQPPTFAVDLNTFSKLMKSLEPEKSDEKIKILFILLDLGGDDYLILSEFLYLVELLKVRITEVKERLMFLEKHIPTIYRSGPSKVLKVIVKHRAFDIFFDMLILANVFTVLVEKYQVEIQLVFWSMFLLELLLRLYVYGAQYFSRLWNYLDILVVLGGFLTVIIGVSTGKTDTNSYRDILLIFRVIRLFKFFTNIKLFRDVFMTLINISISMITYISLILCLYYIYIMIGMELYAGYIKEGLSSPDTCNNPNLAGSDYASLKYCKNNFENIINAFVYMFELMVVNNWFVLANGYILATSKYSRLFFSLFHVTCPVILLNIFTAFLLELYFIETNTKSTFESSIEKRITDLSLNIAKTEETIEVKEENKETPEPTNKFNIKTIIKKIKDKIFGEIYDGDRNIPIDNSKVRGLRFHIDTRGPRPVETLLEKMFTDDFDIRRDSILN